MEILRDGQRAAGLTCLNERDITRKVLGSCDQVAKKRLQAFAADNDASVMADFLGVPGSRVYEDMANGRSSYRIFKLQRPAATSIDNSR